jgi:hypothetical protein
LHAITANTRAENPEAIAAFDLAERAIAKATGTPNGWTHAETSAPDDPTQQDTSNVRLLTVALLNAIALSAGYDAFSIVDKARKLSAALDADHQPTPAAQAVESFIATEQQDLQLPDILAAILRRAERAKSYGRIMMTSKDSCIDDVVRLATRALLLANDHQQGEQGEDGPGFPRSAQP